MSLVLSNKGKGMQSSSEQPLVGEEHCVTTLITAAKETKSRIEWKGKRTALLTPFEVFTRPSRSKNHSSFFETIVLKILDWLTEIVEYASQPSFGSGAMQLQQKLLRCANAK